MNIISEATFKKHLSLLKQKLNEGKDYDAIAAHLPPEEIEAMRDWISECGFPDLDELAIEELTPGEIVKGIAIHFGGGLRGWWETSGR